jgi:hypothetical protein
VGCREAAAGHQQVGTGCSAAGADDCDLGALGNQDLTGSHDGTANGADVTGTAQEGTQAMKAQLIERLKAIVDEIEDDSEPDSPEQVIALLEAASSLTNVSIEGAMGCFDDQKTQSQVDTELGQSIDYIDTLVHVIACDNGLADACYESETEDEEGSAS